MQVSDWISTFMALIATASTVVTYILYRSSTDPLVIVYVSPDLKRPSIVNLIVKNIGKGPAYGVKFEPNRILPAQAFGISAPETNPQKMSSGPMVHGIPFLAPDQQISLTWGQYGGLDQWIGDTPITVNCGFYRVNKPNFFSRKLRSISNLDIRTFGQSESSEHGFGPNLVKELKQLNKTLANFESRIKG